MKRATLTIIVFIIVLSISLVTIPYLSKLRPFTILSVSKVQIEPEGYLDDEDRVRGSYWVATIITDCTDKIAGWRFHNESDRDLYYKGERVDLASEIDVIIDPEPPYWERPLEVHTHQVYPKTYGTSKNWLQQVNKITDNAVPSLSVNTYQFGARAGVPNVWVCHTPFWVILQKDGVELDKQFIDTKGMVEVTTLSNPDDPDETITLTNLGQLSTGYGEPAIDDIICLFQTEKYGRKIFFSGSDEVENKIDYKGDSQHKYAFYWFGGGTHYTAKTTYHEHIEQWTDDGSPAHYYAGHYSGTFLVGDDWYAGNYRDDIMYGNQQAKVIEARVWNDRYDTNPYGKSLVNYLRQYHNELDVNVWKRGYEITDDQFLRIYMPFASVNSVITVRMSTELTDAFVWRPQIANVKFVTCEWDGGGTHADIYDRLMATMTVKQHSSVKSTATIEPLLASASTPLAINPLSHAVDLAPDDTTTVEFEFLNLGTDEDVNNVLDFVIKNKLGDETDRRSLTLTLKPKGVAETILTVHTVDATTHADLSGIPVKITYDSSSQTDNSIEGYVVFDLEGVAGPVVVRALESAHYQTGYAETTVVAGEPNEVTLYLYPRGVVPPPPFPWWIVGLIVVFTVTTIVVFTVLKRRKR